jgi:predicted RNase H-like HicB family nuclease
MTAVLQNRDVSNNFPNSYLDQHSSDEREQDVAAFSIPASYIEVAMSTCKLEPMEDGTWFAELPDFQGVWAQGATEAKATAELEDVLVGWMFLKMQDRDGDIPVISGINLNK